MKRRDARRGRRLIRRSAEDDAARELEFHVAMKTEELIGAGWSRESARREAERRFGDLAKVRDRVASIERRHRRANALRGVVSGLGADIRMGVRSLTRRPGFTLVAVLTLALGIGANAAIFSVVNAVLLRPLPYAEPGRLVALWETHPDRTDRSNVTSGNYMDWRDRLTTVEALAAHMLDLTATLTGDGEPSIVQMTSATANLFDVLGVRAVAGRLFEESDGQPNGAAVAVMSNALWRGRYGGDRAVIGRTLTLNGTDVTVIGVAPPGVNVPSRATGLWIPVPLSEATRQQRQTHMYSVIGRLADGASLEQAQAQLSSVAGAIAREFPENMEGWSARVTPYRADIVRNARSPLLILLGAVVLVLLIACANVSNLLFARGVDREREVAVRSALGASRASLVRQFLAESLVLALAGGVLAVLIAWPVVRVIVRFAPADIPLVHSAGVGGAVLAYSMLIVLATTLMFGTLPALRASRPRIERALAEGRSRGTGKRQSRIRRILVITEVATSLLLVSGAGLLVRSLARLNAEQPGFDMEHVLAVSLTLPGAVYPTQERQVAFFDQLIDRLRSLPNVVSVAGTSEPPVIGYRMTFSIEVDGLPAVFEGSRDDYPLRAITDEYFATMGIDVVRGRAITAADRADGRSVVVVSEAFAHQVWPSADPLGRRIRAGSDGPWSEVIGVVADTRHDGLDAVDGPVVYSPYAQKRWVWMRWMTVMLRTTGDPVGVLPAVQSAIWSLDPDLPVQRAMTIEQIFAESLASRRFTTTLLVTFASLAVVLAIVGLYGVVAWGVAERTREIGVRLALGAEPRRVVASIIGEGLRLSMAGVAIGLVAAFLMRGVIRGLLFEITPFDPPTLASGAMLLVTSACIACGVPARRATRIQPASTLRQE